MPVNAVVRAFLWALKFIPNHNFKEVEVKKLILVLALSSLIISGCATSRTIVIAPKAEVEKALYKIELSALPLPMSNKYNGFIVNIQNKSDSDLEIDWRRTVYIENGVSNGGFIKGASVRGYGPNLDKQIPDSPDIDIVLPGTTYSTQIIPRSKWGNSGSGASILSEVMTGKTLVTGYPLPSGKNGIYFNLNLYGKNHREKKGQ